MNSERSVPKGRIRVPVGGQLTLDFELAPRWKRAIGFVIDSFAISAINTVLFTARTRGAPESDFIESIWPILFAILSTVWIFFGYAVFECVGGGRSQGKFAFGLAVLSRDGAQLTLKQIFTRNFLKWFQVWLPTIVWIQYALKLEVIERGAEDHLYALIASSLVLFNLVPFFRKDRSSVGDLLANTAVVCLPRPMLLPDLGPTEPSKEAQQIAAEAPAIRFTKKQLAIYGVYELSTLEDVIRRGAMVHNAKELIDVANTIARRIGWQPEQGQIAPAAIDFLRAFYGEQRRALEDLKRLGRHRERQEPLGLKPPPPPQG